MTCDDLPETIPIFPLEGALLLPDGLLPLNIFEERYVAMVNHALSTNRIIGMVQPNLDARKNGDANAIMGIGCAGRIVQFSETDDGRYMIMLKGLSRFKVKEELQTISCYRSTTCDWSNYNDDMVEDCDTISIDRDEFFPLLERYFEKTGMDGDWDAIKSAPCETLLTTLPMICPFDSQEQQALLEAKTLDQRFKTLTTLIEMGLNTHDNIVKLRH